MMKRPVTLFLSYAHEDEPRRQELEKHLSLLQRQGVLSTWQDRQIRAGEHWAEVIDAQLERAAVILLLISANFLASDYCYGIEMKRALERHAAGRACVIPVIVNFCDWSGAPFAHLQGLPVNARPVMGWPLRDEAWTAVATGIRRLIEEAPASPASTSSPALPPIWNIPYPRNTLFTGREEHLAHLTSTLKTGQPAALSQPQAISGLGGIGKTQVALEYAYRYGHRYEAVLWALADTRENLISSYLPIATLLNLPERDEHESERVIIAVKNWLQRNTDWLLILDNADDLALAGEFLPPRMSGHVLLTTRAHATGHFAQRVEVDTLSTALGALLLLRRAKVLTAEATLEQAETGAQHVARAICEELGGLPLALDQAGAYIEETGCSLSEYRQLFQHRRADLLADRRGHLVSDHPLPVATTWSLSFQQVEQKNPAAADLLRFCAFLAPDAIPATIMTLGAEHLGPTLAPVSADPYLLNQAIEVLRAYSLLSRGTYSNADPYFLVHRLVQAILKDQMNEEEQQLWTERAIRAVDAAFPEVEHKTWGQCEQLLSHALTCAAMIEHKNLVLLEAASLLNRAGQYLKDHARYSEAEPLYVRALAICEQQLGQDHPETATSLNNLALLYNHQGKYALAEPLYKRTLTIYEQMLGANHPWTATALNNLAALYRSQGKYTQAEPLYVRALAISEQQLGQDHPDTANSLNNLAELYRAQGKDALAQPLYVRALAISEQQLGPDHPHTATSLNNLAGLYRAQGKYTLAEPLYVRALAIREQQLGQDHPDTANSLNNLALLYKNQGKYTLAEPLYVRALAILENSLGQDHPTTQAGRKNYEILLQKMGREKEQTD